MSSINVAVFGSSLTPPGTADWQDGVVVGQRLAEAGFGVITGGYGGTMEAVSQGAAERGAHVIGVTSAGLFPGRSGANRFVTEVLEAQTLTDRIGMMTELASGTLALPGSIGTATELLVAWNINHIVRRNGGTSLPSVAIGPRWKRVGRTLATELGAVEADIHWANDVDEGASWLIDRLQTA